MRHVCAILGLMCLFAAALPAAANDAAMGGSGANVFPLDNADLRLVRERVVFTEVDDNVFTVEARLIFKNTTAKKQTLRLGFPVDTTDSNEFGDYAADPGAKTMVTQFKTWVGGKPVTNQLRRPKKPAWEGQPGNAIFLFTASFPPKKETTVRHTYRLHAGGSVMQDHWLHYVFRTGGKWRGKIEEAVFEFRFAKVNPALVNLVYGEKRLYGNAAAQMMEPASNPINVTKAPKPGAGVRPKVAFFGGPKPRFVITFRDIKPTADLWFNYSNVVPLGWVKAEHPGQKMGWRESKSMWRLNAFYFEHKWDDKLTENFTPGFLRNLLYAGRGYAFKGKRHRDYFYATGIFVESTSPFDPAWLTPREKSLIEKLLAKEKEK
jgi:Domain of unknown function (DUF4424)